MRGDDDTDLAPAIACTVREESVIVATRALGARRDARDPELSRLLSQDRAKIHAGRLPGVRAGQLLVHVGADLIAFAADSRPEVNASLAEGMTGGFHHRQADLEDIRCRAAPPGVQNLGHAG